MLYPLSYRGSGVRRKATRADRPVTNRFADIAVRRARPRRYAWPVTPEQLASTIVDVLQALVDDGDVSLPDGVPTTVVVERPRNKEHGDYATNVALQLAKKAGTQPAGLRRPARRAAAERRRDRGRRHRRPGVPQHHGRGRRPGRGRGRRARGRGGVRPQRRARRRADQRRVHLGQPDRAAAPRPHPVGRGRRRAGPGARRGRRRRGRGSSTSTTAGRRWTSSAPRSRRRAQGEPVPEDGYQGAYVDDVAQQVLAEEPGILDLPDDERAVAFREAGYRDPARGAAEVSSTRSAPTSTSGSPSASLHDGLRRGRQPREAARPGPPVRRRRRACGCAPPTSATTRTGC